MLLIAGSIHFDVLARVTGEATVLDKIGDVAIDIGGTAGNVAIDLANMGVEVRFVTVMNKSAFSDILLTHLKNNKIEPSIIYGDNLSLAAFVGLVDQSGHLESAVSSMPVERVEVAREFAWTATNDVDAIVMDCNLSESSIMTFATIAVERGIPVYVAGVSQPKILRVKKLFGTVPIHALFCNRIEADYLIEKTGAKNDHDIARLIGGAFIVTRRSEGVSFTTAAGTSEFKAFESEVKENSLGAGDALMAMTIYHHLKGLPLTYAIQSGMAAAVAALARENCNLGELDSIEKILTTTKNQSIYDGLTGLLNRAATVSAAESMVMLAKRGSRPLSVIMFDVDDFKLVNDTYGHDVGDLVIREITDIAKETMRESDIVGRWGGEEFVCVLMDAGPEPATEVAQRLCDRIRKSVVNPKPVTVSCGVATLHWNESFQDLVKRADKMLYESKESGKNKVSTAL